MTPDTRTRRNPLATLDLDPGAVRRAYDMSSDNDRRRFEMRLLMAPEVRLRVVEGVGVKIAKTEARLLADRLRLRGVPLVAWRSEADCRLLLCAGRRA